MDEKGRLSASWTGEVRDTGCLRAVHCSLARAAVADVRAGWTWLDARELCWVKDAVGLILLAVQERRGRASIDRITEGAAMLDVTPGEPSLLHCSIERFLCFAQMFRLLSEGEPDDRGLRLSPCFFGRSRFLIAHMHAFFPRPLHFS